MSAVFKIAFDFLRLISTASLMIYAVVDVLNLLEVIGLMVQIGYESGELFGKCMVNIYHKRCFC